MSAKAMLGRVLERNRNGELVVNPIGAGGEDIEPGDVVQVEEPEASAEPGAGSAPTADGRRDAGDNCALACMECNQRKADTTP
jgi:hypothetical protein